MRVQNIMSYPVLYSLQHCPYAMRARMGILLAKQTVVMRAIVLKNKPLEMLKASAKATVPVLVLDESQVIDESLEIMLWALGKNDPCDLLCRDEVDALSAMLALINTNDNEFRVQLDKYKCAKRYHESSESQYRQKCEEFIHHLEQRLSVYDFVMGPAPSLVDYAILPFIRQFSRVDRKWYTQAPYPHLQKWLKGHLQSPLFSRAMRKYPLWLDDYETVLFGGE